MSRLLIPLLAATLAACVEKPVLVLGDEVPPPHGCIEYRKRGGEC